MESNQSAKNVPLPGSPATRPLTAAASSTTSWLGPRPASSSSHWRFTHGPWIRACQAAQRDPWSEILEPSGPAGRQAALQHLFQIMSEYVGPKLIHKIGVPGPSNALSVTIRYRDLVWYQYWILYLIQGDDVLLHHFFGQHPQPEQVRAFISRLMRLQQELVTKSYRMEPEERTLEFVVRAKSLYLDAQ